MVASALASRANDVEATPCRTAVKAKSSCSKSSSRSTLTPRKEEPGSRKRQAPMVDSESDGGPPIKVGPRCRAFCGSAAGPASMKEEPAEPLVVKGPKPALLAGGALPATVEPKARGRPEASIENIAAQHLERFLGTEAARVYFGETILAQQRPISMCIVYAGSKLLQAKGEK